MVPYAQYELALVKKSDGQILESLDLLEKAKSDHKRYLHQTRLHLRIQSVQSEINTQIKSSADND